MHRHFYVFFQRVSFHNFSYYAFPHQPLEVVQKDLIIKPENSLDLFTHIYYICARNSTPPRNMNLSYSWDHQANKSYCTAKLEQLYYMSSGTFFNWELLRIQFYWQLNFTEVSNYASHYVFLLLISFEVT